MTVTQPVSACYIKASIPKLEYTMPNRTISSLLAQNITDYEHILEGNRGLNVSYSLRGLMTFEDQAGFLLSLLFLLLIDRVIVT